MYIINHTCDRCHGNRFGANLPRGQKETKLTLMTAELKANEIIDISGFTNSLTTLTFNKQQYC